MLTSVVQGADLQLLLKEKCSAFFYSVFMFGLDGRGWSVIQIGDTGWLTSMIPMPVVWLQNEQQKNKNKKLTSPFWKHLIFSVISSSTPRLCVNPVDVQETRLLSFIEDC